MSTSTKPIIDLFLLGRFEVARGERTLQARGWSRRKAAMLLQRLALERRLVKEQAIDFLWPEAALDAGANNLYRTLHALRQTLETGLGPGAAVATFTYEDGILSLNETVRVDVHEFERLCATPLNEASKPAIEQLQRALDLYQGDLLPDDLYSEWSLIPRETLRRLHREARLALAAHQGEIGHYPQAIALLTPLLTAEPTDELVHRELIRLYALAGRRHDALRQYQTCFETLSTELELPPEPETTALYHQILNGKLTPPPPPVSPPAWMPPSPVIFEVERSGPLVGRKVELETLQSKIHRVWHGQGQTILLTGDAGVGKTRLAYELLRTAASAGMTTLFGAAYEQEGQLPYQPFIEAFDRYLSECQRLSDNHPSRALGLENPITHFEPRGSTDPQQEHWALFKATARFLVDLTTQRPVILLVDDLHAADETSLRLFHYLARQTRTSPVILLATYRSDRGDTVASPGITLLNALYRERLSQTLPLSPLTEEHVGQMASHLLKGEADPNLIRSVFNLAEGNPFFVQEIIQALVKFEQVALTQAGQWQLRSKAELHLSSGLGDLLRGRVARLGSTVETVLSTAALIGREFSFDILQNLLGLSDFALLDALDVALSGQFLEETDNGYRFRHPLIRRALDEGLSRSRRMWLHARVAEAIETVYSGRPEGLAPHVETLAFHFDASARRDRALQYLLQAGQKAAGLYAFEVAVNYFERALALMDHIGLKEPAQRWPILEALGWWGIILADTPRAVARFEQALALPSAEKWQPSGADRARMHRGAAVALITAGDTGAAEEHLRTALIEITEHEAKDTAEYAFVLYNMAQLYWHRNEYQQAFEAAQRSLAVAERLGDPIAIARAFEMLALACHSMGEWRQGLQFEEQRSALAGATLDVTEAFDVHL
jgi:predicted ATPase